MSMTVEQVVTQLQQELLTLRAQVAAECGLADAVRAINNLATAQVRNDTTSLIGVKGLGRPKEFSGKAEDFQQWSKKTEALFAGVIEESEMMLEWASDQPMEITTTAIDLEFLPTDTNEERGVQNLEFVLQQMHTALTALTSCEANDIVANSRKNPLEAWRRLQKRYDPTTGRKKTKPSAYDHWPHPQGEEEAQQSHPKGKEHHPCGVVWICFMTGIHPNIRGEFNFWECVCEAASQTHLTSSSSRGEHQHFKERLIVAADVAIA